MTVPVYIGGNGPYSFLIDTGAQRSLLSRELASTLALPSGKTMRIISLSGPAQLSTAFISHLRYGNEEVQGLVSPLVAETDLGAPGILGLDSLKGKKLIVDIARGQMDVQDSRAKPEPYDDDGSIVVRARNRFGQLILVNCRVGGASTKVILDTGAEYSIGNMALLRRLSADRLTRAPDSTTLVSVIGGEVAAQIAIVKSVEVGGIVLQDTPIIFTDAAPFNELGLSGKPAMFLGMQILRLFDRVSIDFEHKQVEFTMPQDRPGHRRGE